jgi:uncharacterized damage-inducible protein DinB
MASDLVAGWEMSQEANLFLLQHVPAEHLGASYAARTREIRAQFAHLHDVRLRWLKHAAPAFARGAEPLGKGAHTSAQLRKALVDSAGRVGAFLAECEAKGKVPSWKGPPATFLSYLVAHEAHHRGLVLVTLRQAGQRMPQEVVYGLWDWGKRSSRG